LMQVDEKLCTGCGRCLEVCPTGAIRLVKGVAAIEASLCRECQACLEACPNGAILAVEEVREPVPAPARPVTTGTRPSAGILSTLGSALAFVGREVLPRVVDMLLEQQEGQRTGPFPTGIPRSSVGGQGRRWRWRRRGRR